LCDDAGVKRFEYHGIRHLSAHIAILAESMTLPDIQHLLRHKSILTTQRYVDKARKGAKASQVLGEYLKSATWCCYMAMNEG
jgi:integrase